MRCQICIKKIEGEPKGSRLCSECREEFLKNLGVEDE